MPSCWCFGHLCWLNLGWGYNTAPLSLIWLTFTGLTLKYPFYRCKVENGMEPRKTRSKSSWDGLVFFWFLEIHFIFHFCTLLYWIDLEVLITREALSLLWFSRCIVEIIRRELWECKSKIVWHGLVIFIFLQLSNGLWVDESPYCSLVGSVPATSCKEPRG